MKAKRSKRDQDLHVWWLPAVDPASLHRWQAWIVVRLGVQLGEASDERGAIDYGRELARAFACDLVVHGKNGRIRSKDSFGTDPRRRKG